MRSIHDYPVFLHDQFIEVLPLLPFPSWSLFHLSEPNSLTFLLTSILSIWPYYRNITFPIPVTASYFPLKISLTTAFDILSLCHIYKNKKHFTLCYVTRTRTDLGCLVLQIYMNMIKCPIVYFFVRRVFLVVRVTNLRVLKRTFPSSLTSFLRYYS